MAQIKTLLDILEAAKTDVAAKLDGNLMSAILYGSFSYRDLSTQTSDFENLRGENGAIDRKPDFIVIVSDLEKAIRAVAGSNHIHEDAVKRLLSFRKDSPFYFGLSTCVEYDVELNNRAEKARIPFKVGIISEEEFLKLPSGHNIYLPSRLTKPTNIVYGDKGAVKEVNGKTEEFMDYFVELALRTMPKRFTGEQFVRRYLLVTYLAESYRIFDLIKSKHMVILDSDFYDTQQNKTVTMRSKLQGIVAKRLLGRDDLELIWNNSFYDAVFVRKQTTSLAKLFYDFAMYNLVSAQISLHKNRVTNKLIGGNNVDYVLRKFRQTISTTF